MTKADEIRSLLGALTIQEIAEQVDCSTDYVRAVRSRDANPERAKAWGKARCATPEYRAYNAGKQREYKARMKQLQPA